MATFNSYVTKYQRVCGIDEVKSVEFSQPSFMVEPQLLGFLLRQAAIGQMDAEDLLHPDGWRETAESEKKSEQLGKYVGFVFSHFLIDRFLF